MNMPKSRDMQAKMPSLKVIFNAFWLVTVKVLNSYNTFYIQDFLAAICTELSVEFIQFRKRTGCFYEVYVSFSGTDNYWDGMCFFLKSGF